MMVKSRSDLLTCPLHQVIVALGSNYHATDNLRHAREALEQLCQVYVWSTPYENADYTASIHTPKPNYVNQCGSLILSDKDVTLKRMIEFTKSIEKSIIALNQYDNVAVNQLSTHRQVAIDIDILLISTGSVVEKRMEGYEAINSLEVMTMVAIAERLPFKKHETFGLDEIGIKYDRLEK